MHYIKKTIVALRRNAKHSFSTFLDADSATMALEMADYTFNMTKFTSHIVFIGRFLRKRLIPKGFRLKFHPADGDGHNKRFSKITDSCSRRLMQATMQKLKFQLNSIFTQKYRAYGRFQSNRPPSDHFDIRN